MLWIEINKSSNRTLTDQLYDQIRKLVFSKVLKSKEKMPSTRELAQQLSVSRNIIVNVYDQLIVEGYLTSVEGSGTYVSDNIDFKNYHNLFIEDSIDDNGVDPGLGRQIQNIDFSIGVPDLTSFPRKTWGRLFRETIIDINNDALGYGDSSGYVPLRRTLTEFLFDLKGIRCSYKQIVLVPGATAGLQVLAQLLKNQFKTVFMEDPSYNVIQKIFLDLNYSVEPVPVDDNGIIESHIPGRRKGLVLVTPAHQFPTGSVLSIQRRIRLVEYANKNLSYILENDYDSEFRYKGSPINSLQVLNPGRVFHIGTFSELLFPSLRIGYIVVPKVFINKVENELGRYKFLHSTIDQVVLNEFIKNKHMHRHYKKMIRNYRQKRKKIIDELMIHFGQEIIIHGDDAGLYIMVEFKNIVFNKTLFGKLKENGVVVHSVAENSIKKHIHQNKIILGYGNLTFDQIEKGIKILKQVLFNRV